MASGIGDMVANLAVNTDNWTKGLQKAQSEASFFGRVIQGVFSNTSLNVNAFALMNNTISGTLEKSNKLATTLLRVATAVASVGGVVGSIYAVQRSISRTADTADQAARTGLSGKFLQQLGYAAQQAGVSQESLTKSVTKLTLKVGEAKAGSDSAQASFRKLHVSWEDLQEQSPEQQFETISQALGQIEDPAKRAAAAVDLFGKAGVELAPMFANGAQDLIASLEQASTLGIGLSDEDIARASKADDAMDRLSSTIAAIVDQVSAKLAPVWTAFADTATATLVTMSGTMESLGGVFSWIGDTAATVFDATAKAIVTAFSVGEWALKNFGEIGEAIFLSFRIRMMESFGEMSHFFTTALPGYLTWFDNNWQEIFYTAFDFVATGFINLCDNIRNIWSAIIDWIKGRSEDLTFVWKPLAEGFKNTIKEMPDIPDRVKSELEVKLGNQLANVGQNLGNTLSGTIEKNLKNLPTIKGIIGSAAPVVPVPTATDTEAMSGKKSQKTISGFLEAGSTEAYSAIVQAMNGGPQKVQYDQLSELKKINENIKKTGAAVNYNPVVESFA